MSALAQWTIDSLLALAMLHREGKGLPVRAIRKALAISESVEGYAPDDATLDAATSMLCNSLLSTGAVALRGDVLFFVESAQAPQVDAENLN